MFRFINSLNHCYYLEELDVNQRISSKFSVAGLRKYNYSVWMSCTIAKEQYEAIPL